MLNRVGWRLKYCFIFMVFPDLNLYWLYVAAELLTSLIVWSINMLTKLCGEHALQGMLMLGEIND